MSQSHLEPELMEIFAKFFKSQDQELSNQISNRGFNKVKDLVQLLSQQYYPENIIKSQKSNVSFKLQESNLPLELYERAAEEVFDLFFNHNYQFPLLFAVIEFLGLDGKKPFHYDNIFVCVENKICPGKIKEWVAFLQSSKEAKLIVEDTSLERKHHDLQNKKRALESKLAVAYSNYNSTYNKTANCKEAIEWCQKKTIR